MKKFNINVPNSMASSGVDISEVLSSSLESLIHKVNEDVMTRWNDGNYRFDRFGVDGVPIFFSNTNLEPKEACTWALHFFEHNHHPVVSIQFDNQGTWCEFRIER